MSRLLEFLLGSILITVFTVAFLFFSAVQYILRQGRIADCTWQASAKAWVDVNGDGRMDHGEPPLSNVLVHIADVKTQRMDVHWPGITNKDGDVQFNLSVPGCSDTNFEIYVEIPEGYRITTRTHIEVKPDIWESLSTEQVYYFGFTSDR